MTDYIWLKRRGERESIPERGRERALAHGTSRLPTSQENNNLLLLKILFFLLLNLELEQKYIIHSLIRKPLYFKFYWFPWENHHISKKNKVNSKCFQTKILPRRFKCWLLYSWKCRRLTSIIRRLLFRSSLSHKTDYSRPRNKLYVTISYLCNSNHHYFSSLRTSIQSFEFYWIWPPYFENSLQFSSNPL